MRALVTGVAGFIGSTLADALLARGDRVLGVSIGSFGDRFAKIAGIYGADVTKIAVEWGQAADPAVVRDALAGAPGYRAVLLTHNETSTGVMNPIAVLAAGVVVFAVSADPAMAPIGREV